MQNKSKDFSPDEEVRRALGNKIKQLRIGKNISQQELAQSTEINRSYLSSLENGNKNVTLDILVKIALRLEVPLAKLFEAPSDSISETVGSLFINAGFLSHASSLISPFGIVANKGESLLSKYLKSKKENK